MNERYLEAKEIYKRIGVDTDKAIETLKKAGFEVKSDYIYKNSNNTTKI